MKFTFRELQKCAEREVALRKAVYGKRPPIPEPRRREIMMMEEIATVLKEMADTDPTAPASSSS